MHCKMRYLFDFDLKIHSGQVCILYIVLLTNDNLWKDNVDAYQNVNTFVSKH